MYTVVIQSPIKPGFKEELTAAQMPPVAVGKPSKKVFGRMLQLMVNLWFGILGCP